MPGMSRIDEHHRRLHQLAGTWIGEETLSPSPNGPGGTAVGRFTMYTSVDGFFVLQDYLEEKDERVVYRGHGIFGWDEVHKAYAWYWVDSSGAVPASPSRGQWRNDTLVFDSAAAGDRRGRYTYSFTAPDAFRFQIESSYDAGKTWEKVMQGSYKRT